ncbi:hypothetical protein SAMN05216391_10965 [Lachnospiraceae bacterium KHCPX20]|nr:hypothetical protein SAMN05216391_10965 [Lachnospiraceae bacterium KHCPX20]
MIIKCTPDRAVMLAKIGKLYPGNGRARGWKVMRELTFTGIEGRRKKIMCNFWNSKDPEKAQLASRVKIIPEGEQVLLIIAFKNDEYTALAMLEKEGTFIFGEGENKRYIGYGPFVKNPKREDEIALKVHMKGGIKYNIVGFTNPRIYKQISSLDPTRKIICIGKYPRRNINKAGIKSTYYTGEKLIIL